MARALDAGRGGRHSVADDLSGMPLPPERVFGVAHPFLIGLERLEAGSDTIALVVARVAPQAWDATTFDAFGIPFPDRLAHAVVKRRAGYLSGRIAVVAAQAALGLNRVDIGSETSGAPRWPDGMTGSISHTEGLAVAAIAREGRIGVDIEAVPDGARLRALCEETLSGDERDLLPSPRDATLGFSAKESLYKALWPEVRSFFGFDAAKVTAVGVGTITLRLTRDLTGAHHAGRTYDLRWRAGGGHVLTWLVAPLS